MNKDELFMGHTLKIAAKTLEKGEFPVSAILVHEDKILFESNRENSKGKNEIDHAEILLLKKFYANPISKNIDKSKLIIYVNLEPCLMCFAAIIISGIRKIVYAYEDIEGGGTNCNLDSLNPLYQKNIEIVPNVLRDKSHKLFFKFFQNPNNQYLKNSMLATYTLNLSINNHDAYNS